MLFMVMHPVAFLTRYMYIVLIQLIQNLLKSSEWFTVIWLLNSVERKKITKNCWKSMRLISSFIWYTYFCHIVVSDL